jgi:hypothetical protein
MGEKASGGGGRKGRSGGGGGKLVKGAGPGGPTERGNPESGDNYKEYSKLMDQYNDVRYSYDMRKYGMNPPPEVEAKLAKLRPKLSKAKKKWINSLPESYKDMYDLGLTR